MKILLTTAEQAGWGGSWLSLSLLSTALHSAGMETALWTPWARSPGTLPSERTFMHPGFHWRVAIDVARSARRMDLVHAQDRRILLGSLLGAKIAGKPAILTLRDIGLCCPIATCLLWEGPAIPADCGQCRLWRRCAPWYGRAYGISGRLRPRLALRYALLAFERRVAMRYDALACPSQGLARHYAPFFPGKKIEVLPSPVEPLPAGHECPPEGDRPTVLFVGKPSLGKGFPDFLRAAACFRQANVPVRFVQIGAPPTSTSSLVEHGGSGDVAFVQSWLCRASLVVVPSRGADALPRAALEAAAHGKPLVGTRAGGIPEIVVEPLNGYLVSPGRPQELARAIRLVLDMPAHARATLGQASRELTLSRFGPEVIALTHERLYEEILQ